MSVCVSVCLDISEVFTSMCLFFFCVCVGGGGICLFAADGHRRAEGLFLQLLQPSVWGSIRKLQLTKLTPQLLGLLHSKTKSSLSTLQVSDSTKACRKNPSEENARHQRRRRKQE